MILCNASTNLNRTPCFTLVIKSMAADRTAATATGASPPRRRAMSAFEARISLVFALASQSQRQICCDISVFLFDLANDTGKYVFPKRFESRNLEEALMAVPDLETVKYKCSVGQSSTREVEPYFIAETTMPGKTGFDFNGASQPFNVLSEYLFGKNTIKEKMEMTTPVFTRKTQSDGEKMEMTAPVVTKKMEDQDKWHMSSIMPSKYGANLPLRKDPTVRIKEVSRKGIALLPFQELKLLDAVENDSHFRVKEAALVEVARYNPPFTLPFTRRNEIALDVEKKEAA